MLQIRHAQMIALERELEEDCIQFVTEFISAQLFNGDPRGSSAVSRERVREGIARAERYGFEKYSHLAAFVALLFHVGPEFDRHPFCQTVLTDPDIEVDDRLTVLAELGTDQDWQDASDISDDSWMPDDRS